MSSIDNSNLAVLDPPAAGQVVPATAPEPTIGMILQAAVQSGQVDALEKLAAIYERELARRAAMAFNAAMTQFKTHCPAILKVKTASFSTKSGGSASYNFAPLEEITKVVDPVLNRFGLSYHWTSRRDDRQIVVTCTVSHVDGHSRSADFACELGGSPLMSAPQVAASTVTFARRYSLVLGLGLTTDEDDDARRPEALPQPDADPSAPKVATRAERAVPPDPNRVTAGDLNALLAQYRERTDKPDASPAEMAKWAAGVTGADAAQLTVPRNWTRAGLERCKEAMA